MSRFLAICAAVRLVFIGCVGLSFATPPEAPPECGYYSSGTLSIDSTTQAGRDSCDRLIEYNYRVVNMGGTGVEYLHAHYPNQIALSYYQALAYFNYYTNAYNYLTSLADANYNVWEVVYAYATSDTIYADGGQVEDRYWTGGTTAALAKHDHRYAGFSTEVDGLRTFIKYRGVVVGRSGGETDYTESAYGDSASITLNPGDTVFVGDFWPSDSLRLNITTALAGSATIVAKFFDTTGTNIQNGTALPCRAGTDDSILVMLSNTGEQVLWIDPPPLMGDSAWGMVRGPDSTTDTVPAYWLMFYIDTTGGKTLTTAPVLSMVRHSYSRDFRTGYQTGSQAGDTTVLADSMLFLQGLSSGADDYYGVPGDTILWGTTRDTIVFARTPPDADTGEVATAGTTFITSSSLAQGDDHWVGATLTFLDGTFQDTTRIGLTFTDAGDSLTFSALSGTPAVSDSFMIVRVTRTNKQKNPDTVIVFGWNSARDTTGDGWADVAPTATDTSNGALANCRPHAYLPVGADLGRRMSGYWESDSSSAEGIANAILSNFPANMDGLTFDQTAFLSAPGYASDFANATRLIGYTSTAKHVVQSSVFIYRTITDSVFSWRGNIGYTMGTCSGEYGGNPSYGTNDPLGIDWFTSNAYLRGITSYHPDVKTFIDDTLNLRSRYTTGLSYVFIESAFGIDGQASNFYVATYDRMPKFMWVAMASGWKLLGMWAYGGSSVAGYSAVRSVVDNFSLNAYMGLRPGGDTTNDRRLLYGRYVGTRAGQSDDPWWTPHMKIDLGDPVKYVTLLSSPDDTQFTNRATDTPWVSNRFTFSSGFSMQRAFKHVTDVDTNWTIARAYGWQSFYNILDTTTNVYDTIIGTPSTTTLSADSLDQGPNHWATGWVKILTGTRAGDSVAVTSSVLGSLTFDALGGTPAAGDSFHVHIDINKDSLLDTISLGKLFYRVQPNGDTVNPQDPTLSTPGSLLVMLPSDGATLLAAANVDVRPHFWERLNMERMNIGGRIREIEEPRWCLVEERR